MVTYVWGEGGTEEARNYRVKDGSRWLPRGRINGMEFGKVKWAPLWLAMDARATGHHNRGVVCQELGARKANVAAA